MPRSQIGRAVTSPMPWRHQQYISNELLCSQRHTKIRSYYQQRALWVLGCRKCSLTLFASPDLSVRPQMHCATMHSWESLYPIDDLLPVMSVHFSQNHDAKGRIKPNYVSHNCGDTGGRAKSPGLFTVCLVTTPTANTFTPTLAILLTGQAKDAFYGQVQGTVENRS